MKEKQFYSILEMLISPDEEIKDMALILIETLNFKENFIPISLLYRFGRVLEEDFIKHANVTYQNLVECYGDSASPHNERKKELLLSTNDIYKKCIQGGWEESPNASEHIKILLKYMNNVRVSFMQKAYRIDGLDELIHPIDE